MRFTTDAQRKAAFACMGNSFAIDAQRKAVFVKDGCSCFATAPYPGIVVKPDAYDRAVERYLIGSGFSGGIERKDKYLLPSMVGPELAETLAQKMRLLHVQSVMKLPFPKSREQRLREMGTLSSVDTPASIIVKAIQESPESFVEKAVSLDPEMQSIFMNRQKQRINDRRVERSESPHMTSDPDAFRSEEDMRWQSEREHDMDEQHNW